MSETEKFQVPLSQLEQAELSAACQKVLTKDGMFLLRRLLWTVNAVPAKRDVVEVPREPTEAMLEAGALAVLRISEREPKAAIRAAYNAMLRVKTGGEEEKIDIDSLLARIKLETNQRRSAMPDEQSAIDALFNAWLRLKELGWSEPIYCPKDGSSFCVIEMGSTGIHTAHYADHHCRTGSWWVHAHGDLWPSQPVLFKPAAQEGGNDLP